MDSRVEFYKTELLYKLASKVVFWVAICFIAYQIQLAIIALAGKTTIADFVVGWFGEGSGLTITLSFSATFIASMWAIVERKLRLKKVANLGMRNTLNEERLDPMRSSSELNVDGTTNPNDK